MKRRKKIPAQADHAAVGREVREPKREEKKEEEEIPTASKCHYCRFRALPIELNENKHTEETTTRCRGGSGLDYSSTRSTYYQSNCGILPHSRSAVSFLHSFTTYSCNRTAGPPPAPPVSLGC